MNRFDMQIVDNLRFKYGPKLFGISDELLLKNYNYWNQSAKDEVELDWLLMEDD